MKFLRVTWFVICAWSFQLHAATHLPMVEGQNLITTDKVRVSAEKKKGLVVVFLSATCPCSNSHLEELKSLAQTYSDFMFVGVHSNTDEKLEDSKAYFKKANLPFPVIQDDKLKLADELKAYKTPHAFVIGPNSEIVYQGGVSSQRDFSESGQKFLREALDDLAHERTVRTARGRTLGCIISRGTRSVW